MTTAIAFERVSKVYRRGHAPSFREDTVNALRRVVGRSTPDQSLNALRDVSFEVAQGTSFALMGANGSGKTTAIKLISRVTYPTAGRVSVAGRVGALIEVGTGLHSELTGRENVWLYGRILGMRRAEIARHFDSIVEFADIGRALDQPIKQYSSGMQLRLGFSLAAHLEPDVLLVDEAIAVGDAGFQTRCLERMAQLRDSGATLIFVSHSPAQVASLCASGLLLRSGEVARIGRIDEVIAGYLNDVMAGDEVASESDPVIRVLSWDYTFAPGDGKSLGDLVVRLQLDVTSPPKAPRFNVAVCNARTTGTLIGCALTNNEMPPDVFRGRIEVTCEITELPLEPGQYEIWVSALDDRSGKYILDPRLLGFVSLGGSGSVTGMMQVFDSANALVRAPYHWTVAQADNLTDKLA